jgi:hypothetical protein
MTFADCVIHFNSSLKYTAKLPDGISVMNPFGKGSRAMDISSLFYKKYYDDNIHRFFIAGINPGRFGAGVTGIPFTDTKRLKDKCGIEFNGLHTHEPSSVFIYEMIDAFGGVEKFYSKFYINSICPLGFTRIGNKGKEINYNYYDTPELYLSAYPFIIKTLKQQVKAGLHKNVCFCLGTGKNFKYFQKINLQNRVFKEIIPLEHPRYIMQYKSRQRNKYIGNYLTNFEKYT